MSKTITINNGGRYDDQSYTDERHYHYEGGSRGEEKNEGGKADAACLRVRLRFVETLLAESGIDTRNTDRIKLCRLMAFATGTSEGYVKKIFTERHVDVSQPACQRDMEKLQQLIGDAGLDIEI
jgi:hypothetical protein